MVLGGHPELLTSVRSRFFVVFFCFFCFLGRILVRQLPDLPDRLLRPCPRVITEDGFDHRSTLYTSVSTWRGGGEGEEDQLPL